MAVPVAVVFVGIGLLLLAVRILRLASSAAAPFLYYTSSEFNKIVLQHCPLLFEPYIPPLLWGKSGHIQSIVYGKKGRFRIPVPVGTRHQTILADGATLTYDIFEPLVPHSSEDDFTMVVCPGISNSSESQYIRTFVDFSLKAGYRVAVLNHLGAIRTIPLTAPRMFTYGGTHEYGVLVDTVKAMYPNTQLLGVGFSMGGNIMTKYLGEAPENQERFLCAVSCCQGYDAAQSLRYMMEWEQMRRGYVWAMAQHQKKFFTAHRDVLFGEDSEKRYGKFDVERIFKATSLVEMDELYSSRRAGYSSAYDYYSKESCCHVMDNITIPMFILNALDDPLIREDLHVHPKALASKRDNVLFVTTQHGGHLGYFEGGLLVPESVTWLDKIVVQYIDAVIQVKRSGVTTLTS